MEKEIEDGAVSPQELQHSISVHSAGETCELQAAVSSGSSCEWLGAIFKQQQQQQRSSGITCTPWRALHGSCEQK